LELGVCLWTLLVYCLLLLKLYIVVSTVDEPLALLRITLQLVFIERQMSYKLDRQTDRQTSTIGLR
jgi:hypothetical protein